jgi:transcriptional regulator with XRE-family HTH domain
LLGKRLVELRGSRTQQYIANQLGISRARYSHYENNYVQPDHALLKKMAAFYHVSIDYLLNRSDDDRNAMEFILMGELKSVALDEVIQKYPLEFMGHKLELTDDDKRAVLAFIKTLQDFKDKETGSNQKHHPNG